MGLGYQEMERHTTGYSGVISCNHRRSAPPTGYLYKLAISLRLESRGATLEAVVSRMKLISQHSSMVNTGSALSAHINKAGAAKMRFIALSATIPNIKDVAKWLNVDEEGCKQFGEEYRPIQVASKGQTNVIR